MRSPMRPFSYREEEQERWRAGIFFMHFSGPISVRKQESQGQPGEIKENQGKPRCIQLANIYSKTAPNVWINSERHCIKNGGHVSRQWLCVDTPPHPDLGAGSWSQPGTSVFGYRATGCYSLDFLGISFIFFNFFFWGSNPFALKPCQNIIKTKNQKENDHNLCGPLRTFLTFSHLSNLFGPVCVSKLSNLFEALGPFRNFSDVFGRGSGKPPRSGCARSGCAKSSKGAKRFERSDMQTSLTSSKCSKGQKVRNICFNFF